MSLYGEFCTNRLTQKCFSGMEKAMQTHYTADLVSKIAEQSGFHILGQEVLPGNDARFLPIPLRLHERFGNQIAQSYPDGLYGHQAEAIDACLKGR